MTLFGLAALLAPVVGPTLGGWLTDQYEWRWVLLRDRQAESFGRAEVAQATGDSADRRMRDG